MVSLVVEKEFFGHLMRADGLKKHLIKGRILDRTNSGRQGIMLTDQ